MHFCIGREAPPRMTIPVLKKMTADQVNKARMGSGHGPGCEGRRTLISGSGNGPHAVNARK
eukprot:3210264-Alexandrium_andersonii.AAC.1